jgi:hypothetical protein
MDDDNSAGKDAKTKIYCGTWLRICGTVMKDARIISCVIETLNPTWPMRCVLKVDTDDIYDGSKFVEILEHDGNGGFVEKTVDKGMLNEFKLVGPERMDKGVRQTIYFNYFH